MKAVLDIETNMSHTEIWGGYLLPLDQPTGLCFRSRSELASLLSRGNYTTLIGHNLIGFDVPMLRDIWDIDLSGYEIHDTILLARLLFPSIGSHSLDAWCKRLSLKNQKGEFTDYDGGWTAEMDAYCLQDVQANADLYRVLMEKKEKHQFSDRSFALEHDVATIIEQQVRNGFYFNQAQACELHNNLTESLATILADLQIIFPPKVEERVSEKTGKPLKPRITHFNPGSRTQVAERFQKLGAVFAEQTPTGHPKVSEKILNNLDLPEAKRVAEYMATQKLQGLLTGWLDNTGDDGRIHGRVITNGAVTGRMTHHSPNLAQVPRHAEYRALFTAPEGRVLVGCDAKSLELRMLAHYMKDPEYIEAVCGPDIHSYNMEKAGLTDRDQAKTFIYAFLYGAGDAKIGEVVGGNAKDGADLKARFLEGLPALAGLLDNLKDVMDNSIVSKQNGEIMQSLPGLDGRRIWVRTPRAVLNTLLQGAGAVVMKEALVVAHTRLGKLDAQFVANVHDEWQVETNPAVAELVGRHLRDGIVQAGVNLNLRCPLDGDYKIGRTWAETH